MVASSCRHISFAFDFGPRLGGHGFDDGLSMASHLTGASQATELANEPQPDIHLPRPTEESIEYTTIANQTKLKPLSPIEAAVLQADCDVIRAQEAVTEACNRINREVEDGHNNGTDPSLTSSRIQQHMRDGAEMAEVLAMARKRAKKVRKLAAHAASLLQTGVNMTQNE